MYTLGIPDRLKTRTLGYLKQQFVDFEEERSMDTPTPSQLAALQEQKVRKAIRKLMRQ